MSKVRKIDDPSLRDQLIWAGYGASNLAKLGWVGLKQGPRGLAEQARRYPWLKTMLRINEIHDSMTRGRRGIYREANAVVVSAVATAVSDMLEGVFEHPELTVLHEDLTPPEILYGMGLNPWMTEFLGIVLPMIDATYAEHYIDIAESAGVPADICSLPKSTIGMAIANELPRPAALLTSNMPCDGGMSQYTIIERELNVPVFRLDVPYEFRSERAIAYFVGELERMIAWLEAHTPGRMDWDRMREVCAERNRALEYQLDTWDLIRRRPAPMAAEPIYLTHMICSVAQPGAASSTATFKKVLDLTRKNFENGVGALEDERYRVALWNPPTMIALDLFAWAEREYGTAMIMDMLTYHRHPFIDTSTPDTMLRGLAQCMMQGPMARHTRGPAANFFSDLFQLYEHFDLDMIWMAGHIGCKNSQALNGMFREKCRERDIPLLIIDYDLSDTRIVSPSAIRGQVEQFMETVMKAEKLAPSGATRSK